MAHYTGSASDTSIGSDILRLIGAPFRALAHGMAALVAANRLAREYDELFHASDAKLAALGINRAEIATYLERNSKNMHAL